MPALSEADVRTALTALPGWRLADGTLVQDRLFPDFVQAMGFVAAVAGLAEQHGHHPDIDIRYNRVHLCLVTHDQGGITSKDLALAADIDRLPAAD